MQRRILLPLIGGVFALAFTANAGQAAVSANHLAVTSGHASAVSKICHRKYRYSDVDVPVRQYRPARYYRPVRYYRPYYYRSLNYYRPVRFYRPWRRW